MRARGHWVAAFLSLTFAARAQNLVINPSFEERNRCPNHFSSNQRDFNLPGWRSANTGTPDYYNQCSWGECDVPFNWAGESNAHSGVAYAGIYVWNRPNKTPRSYREYIHGELLEPLREGKRYRIEFYFKLASYSVYTADRVGMMLSDSLLFLPNDQVIERVPALSWIGQEPLVSGGWQLASGEYRATGGERYVVIGNFFDNLNTQFTQLEARKGRSPMLGGSAYFYIDDVSVVPLDPPDSPAEKPLVWEDGTEVRTEEVHVLRNIQFEFDRYVLLPVSFTELNKVVEILNQQPQWRAELSGHTDYIGSDEYNLELSQNRANSVRAYLISRGIAPERLSAQGYGKSRPMVNERDDHARMVNRRVEVKFVK